MPVIRPRSRLAPSGVTRFLPSRVSISPCTKARPLSTRSWSRSVITTGTFSCRRNSVASWPAISPAPTTPTLVTGRARLGVGRTCRLPRPLADQIEGVQARPQLVAHDQVGERLVLRRVRARSGRRSGRRPAAPGPGTGAGAAPPTLRSTKARASASTVVPAPRSRSTGGPLDGRSSRRPPGPAQSSERSRKSAPSNIASARAQRVRGPSRRASGSGSAGSRRIRVTARSIADQVGHQVRPAPAGHQAQEALRQRDPGRGGGHGAVVGSAARPPAHRPAPCR